MKNNFFVVFKVAIFALFVLCSFQTANAQTWNSNAGGYNGGYGQVYQSFGLAQATINMQNTTQMQIQRAMMRQAMEKKWGKKAVANVMDKPSGNRTSNSTRNNAPATVSAQTVAAPTNYAFFKPVPGADNYKTIIDTLGSTAEEKAVLKLIFSETKKAFETQAASMNGKNNIAAALVFFIAASVTVYNDAPEPSDAATESLYRALNSVIDETPEMKDVPNADKQKLYDSLISFSGLIMSGYIQGKQTNDKELTNQYRQIAGVLIEMILKSKPNKIRFVNDTLQIDK